MTRENKRGTRAKPRPSPTKTLRMNIAKSKYIEAVAAGALVAEASDAAGVNRVTPYRWRDEDPVFAAELSMAEKAGVAAVESVAFEGATIGWEKPIFHNGIHVATVRERNPTLVMFLLKSRDPLRYCDRLRAEAKLREWEKADKDAGEDTSAAISERAFSALERLEAQKSGGHGTDNQD